jgi:hypothetical protein
VSHPPIGRLLNNEHVPGQIMYPSGTEDWGASRTTGNKDQAEQ